MMIDARRIPTGETIETEVCIIGAGPAGITLARELAGQNFRVCLLETGGLEPNANIQALAAGADDTIGDFYPGAIYMRTRQYGGTANQWDIDMTNSQPQGAKPLSSHASPEEWNAEPGVRDRGVRYVPMDEIDFEKRDWVPYSGWCIRKTDLDPYYERAHVVCKAGPYDYSVEAWEDEEAKRLPFQSDRVTTRMFRFGPRDVFIHEYRKELEQSNNVTIYLYATAVELETDDLAKTVTRVRVGCLEGPEFWVSAKQFILTMGGLENPRLLLLSDKVQKNGLGNQNDLVGRFLMDHPLVRAGMLIPSDRNVFNSLGLYDTRWVNGTMGIAKPVLTEEMMRREQLLNINAILFPRASIYQMNLLRMLFPQGKRYRSKAVGSAQALLKAARRKQLPKDLLKHAANLLTGIDDLAYYQWRKKPRFLHRYGLDTGGWSRLPDKEKQFGCFEVFHITEQAPDPDNRVALGSERDQLGCRKVQLYWHWNDINIRSTRRSMEIFAEEFKRVGLGHLRLELDHGVPQVFLPSIHHHIGTTRMHDDPKQGVVDANCQVHGVSNLYIASSSVFPTGGYANPTLTIIAIAIRVADQIKTVMAS